MPNYSAVRPAAVALRGAYIEVDASDSSDGLLCSFSFVGLRTEEYDLRMVRLRLINGDNCPCTITSLTVGALSKLLKDGMKLANLRLTK